MPLNAQGYFNALRSYLNRAHYEVKCSKSGKILMNEVVFLPANKSDEIKIYLDAPGDAFVINLDKKKTKKSTQSDPLFHFLDDNGMPWSKRCDFVVFHLHRGSINVLCFEFKWETLPVDRIIPQLEASEAWCRSLHSVIKHYTSKKRRFNLTKYVLSRHPDPSPYLDAEGHYLQRDHSIRHYHYDDLKGLSLADLENSNVEAIN